MTLAPGDALIIVDVQNDFLPGGSLAVPDGNKIIPVLNQYVDSFYAQRLPICATRDWHPENHCSFRQQGGIWPSHCVAHSDGAAFASSLKLPVYANIISKATTPKKDAYSAFSGTQLHKLLHSLGVVRLFVGGLATEYCVCNTVEDAIRYRYETFVLADAVAALNQQPGDGVSALEKMQQFGATLIFYEALVT